jgi:predicted DsbA family dithiol-disulfide isomerase
LLNACIDAGIGKEEANRVVEDDNEGLIDVKKLIQEQLSDGVDSVPNIIFEGKKRDFTLIGAKEVDEYVKTMEQILKESS